MCEKENGVNLLCIAHVAYRIDVELKRVQGNVGVCIVLVRIADAELRSLLYGMHTLPLAV